MIINGKSLTVKIHTQDLNLQDSCSCKLIMDNISNQRLNIKDSHICKLTVRDSQQKLIIDGTSDFVNLKSNIFLSQILGVDVSKIELDMNFSADIKTVNTITATLFADMNISADMVTEQTIDALLTYLVDVLSDISFGTTITATLTDGFEFEADIKLKQIITATLTVLYNYIPLHDSLDLTVYDSSSNRVCMKNNTDDAVKYLSDYTGVQIDNFIISVLGE